MFCQSSKQLSQLLRPLVTKTPYWHQFKLKASYNATSWTLEHAFIFPGGILNLLKNGSRFGWVLLLLFLTYFPTRNDNKDGRNFVFFSLNIGILIWYTYMECLLNIIRLWINTLIINNILLIKLITFTEKENGTLFNRQNWSL